MTKKKAATAANAQSAKARKQVLEGAAEQKAKAAATVGVELNAGAVEKARKEGALQAERDQGAASYKYATDGNLPGEEPQRQLLGHEGLTNQIAPLLAQGVEQFEATIAEDAPNPLDEVAVAGLLALERNGQNRTPYVKACIKRLGLKEGDPLPGGGPDYTNDVHPVSDLYS